MSSGGSFPTYWPWGRPAGAALACLTDADLTGGVDDPAHTFAAWAAKGELALPAPGGGQTRDRFRALAEVSAVDLALGRLVEGHTDAIAILAEARRQPPPGAVMGVWAARRRDADVTAARHRGGWRLKGRKPWASGAHVLTHALVTAATDEGSALFEVALARDGVTVVPGTWAAVGMAMSDSADVAFDLWVDDGCRVGPPGWYVDRPGFWFGSVGVAACWLGGALGLVRALGADLATRPADSHQLAHLGAAAARGASMARDVTWGAARIDLDPLDPDRQIRPVALEVRHLVEGGCLDILTDVGRAGGPGPLC